MASLGKVVKGVCTRHWTGILNRGSGGRGQWMFWVHLTRDDHANITMFQARAL